MQFWNTNILEAYLRLMFFEAVTQKPRNLILAELNMRRLDTIHNSSCICFLVILKLDKALIKTKTELKKKNLGYICFDWLFINKYLKKLYNVISLIMFCIFIIEYIMYNTYISWFPCWFLPYFIIILLCAWYFYYLSCWVHKMLW